MRPVADSQKISRAKLAFIIDATAAPVCMIAPISSWAAAVSATAQDLNTGISGIQLFIRAIPYNFYAIDGEEKVEITFSNHGVTKVTLPDENQ